MDTELDTFEGGREDAEEGERETSFIDDDGDDDENTLITNESNPTIVQVDDDYPNPTSIPPLPGVGEYRRSVTQAKKEFLEKGLGVRLNKGDGPKSKKLSDNLRVILDGKGKKINGAGPYPEKLKKKYSANKTNARDITEFKKLLGKAQLEYVKTLTSVIDNEIGTSSSDGRE